METLTSQKVIKLAFVGIDNWNRPVYKNIDRKEYYGSVDCLYSCEPKESVKEINDFFRKNIKELEYFGTSFGCEPMGGLKENIKLVIL